MKLLEHLNVQVLIVFYLFCKVYSNLLKYFIHKNTRTLKWTIFDFLIAFYLFCKV